MRTMAATIMFAAVCSVAVAAESTVELAPDSAAVAQCTRLAEVKGSSAWGGMLTNMAYNRALNSLKSRAAKLGATHLLLLSASSGFSGSNMLGIAYKCPTASSEVGEKPPATQLP